MGKIGVMELILIFGIALVIFGPGKLPEVGKAMGKAISEFKRYSFSNPNEEDNNSKKSKTDMEVKVNDNEGELGQEKA